MSATTSIIPRVESRGNLGRIGRLAVSANILKARPNLVSSTIISHRSWGRGDESEPSLLRRMFPISLAFPENRDNTVAEPADAPKVPLVESQLRNHDTLGLVAERQTRRS